MKDDDCFQEVVKTNRSTNINKETLDSFVRKVGARGSKGEKTRQTTINEMIDNCDVVFTGICHVILVTDSLLSWSRSYCFIRPQTPLQTTVGFTFLVKELNTVIREEAQ